MIDLEKVEKVVHAYGKTVEEVSSDPDRMLKYPAFKWPESLLPYPKRVIEYALAKALEQVDAKTAETLRSVAILLDRFVSDEDFIAEREKMLATKKGLEAVFKLRD